MNCPGSAKLVDPSSFLKSLRYSEPVSLVSFRCIAIAGYLSLFLPYFFTRSFSRLILSHPMLIPMSKLIG